MPASVPKLKIVYRDIDTLIPYVNNARKHSEDQVAMIAASIREFGFNNPVLLDGERGVIAGHGRLLGARRLGMTQVPCIDLEHLTPIQKRAYILADNSIAEKATWDNDLLSLEMEALREAEFDTSFLGIELEPLPAFGGGGNEQSVAIPETFEVVVSCANESEQQRVFDQLTEMGLTCHVLTL